MDFTLQEFADKIIRYAEDRGSQYCDDFTVRPITNCREETATNDYVEPSIRGNQG